MTEVYVKKEIMPLLLKAKCPLEKVIKQDFRPVYYTKDYDDPTWQDCDAYYVPTQSQVMKWLREVHDVFIEVRIYGRLDAENKIFFYAEIYVRGHRMIVKSIITSNYDAVCNWAIRFSLENLAK